MSGFGTWIVKHRTAILIVAAALMVPSVLGMAKTRINYDMLQYLPEDIETVKGQDMLLDEFNKGAISSIILEGMDAGEVSALKAKIEAVDHVDSVVWYDSFLDVSTPMEMLPQKYYDAFNSGEATMMVVFFDSSTSSDETMKAIRSIRGIVSRDCFVTGMSALVTDLKDLCEKEEPIYVGLAVLCATAAMMIFMDSWIIPFVFLISIGMAILCNMGTNFFLGEISYITKALSAVLQLAVTMDYSIFLWHSYEEQLRIKGLDRGQAMAAAINMTLTSVIGSSVTTVAGFIALCFMSYTLGMDLGIVMAKGVVFGVIGCVTTLPALILALDRLIMKTRHRALLPKMDRIAAGIAGKPAVFLLIFLLVLAPAAFGYHGTNDGVYYDLGNALPEGIDYVKAERELNSKFDLASTHMALVSSDMPQKDMEEMMSRIDGVKGVKACLGLSSVIGPAVPEEALPEEITGLMKSDRHQLLLISSEYKVASDRVNRQVDEILSIIKDYDGEGMLIGEAPATRDLISITGHDFNVVNMVSIALVFLIIALVFRSISLPFILLAIIEFAVFINLGIPYYTGVSLPFIAPICISTIQLGSTVDYAILMTTRYKSERTGGADKRRAVSTALAASIPSIIVSAASFFAATFGVALYSGIDIISSMCTLLARGAVVSMLAVILILPSALTLFDGLIIRSTAGMKHLAVRAGTEAERHEGGNI